MVWLLLIAPSLLCGCERLEDTLIRQQYRDDELSGRYYRIIRDRLEQCREQSPRPASPVPAPEWLDRG